MFIKFRRGNVNKSCYNKFCYGKFYHDKFARISLKLNMVLFINCTNVDVQFCKITELAYDKYKTKGTLEKYPYLKVGDQVCHPHYCLHNKFVNQYKLEVGLYLMASGATWEAVDAMSKLGYSVCANTVEAYRKQSNSFHIYNIDDYYAIHENCRPDTVSTSTANHFATCVAKPVMGYCSVPIIFNDILIHNPANVTKECQLRKISHRQDLAHSNFDPIKTLMVHSYADNIEENKEEYLFNFNEYYVENVHSKIRANTSPNATADNIIKQVYITMNHNNIAFKDNYCKKRRYPYTPIALNFLSDKTALFLLQHFQDIFYNREKSGPKPNKKEKKTITMYRLATLDENVDLRHLPIAYSTAYPPHPKLCDRCDRPFINDNEIVLICGHRYHFACYNVKCTYCEEFYKKERIEKGADTLIKKDLDDDDDDIESIEESLEEAEETLDVSSKLVVEIDQIKYW
ncbi:hypothetical protein C2G38_2035039 [Gigaspora rosea]|uniref:Uncharacterized protein n=1 Tax=Gigaspora rosea TaxID=44941 RepID=A0A397VE01_9GLOM|nr:hypothetical protein C2G38_2035039 [Gigaspora rosea]